MIAGQHAASACACSGRCSNAASAAAGSTLQAGLHTLPQPAGSHAGLVRTKIHRPGRHATASQALQQPHMPSSLWMALHPPPPPQPRPHRAHHHPVQAIACAPGDAAGLDVVVEPGVAMLAQGLGGAGAPPGHALREGHIGPQHAGRASGGLVGRVLAPLEVALRPPQMVCRWVGDLGL